MLNYFSKIVFSFTPTGDIEARVTFNKYDVFMDPFDTNKLPDLSRFFGPIVVPNSTIILQTVDCGEENVVISWILEGSAREQLLETFKDNPKVNLDAIKEIQ